MTNVPESLNQCEHEIYGPVKCVYKFKQIDDLMRNVNVSSNGLLGAVHTRDLKTAMDVIQRLEVGTVYVNCFNLTFNQICFGGIKESGFGRDLGKEALQEFTRCKSVIINLL